MPLSDYAPTFFSSSKTGRKSQRTSGYSEFIGQTILNNYITAIPVKVVQTAAELYALCSKDTHISEKIVALLQAGLTITQIGLAITMLFEGEQCNITGSNVFNSDTSNLCKADFLLDMLYAGILATGWGASELSKTPAAAVAPV